MLWKDMSASDREEFIANLDNGDSNSDRRWLKYNNPLSYSMYDVRFDAFQSMVRLSESLRPQFAGGKRNLLIKYPLSPEKLENLFNQYITRAGIELSDNHDEVRWNTADMEGHSLRNKKPSTGILRKANDEFCEISDDPDFGWPIVTENGIKRIGNTYHND